MMSDRNHQQPQAKKEDLDQELLIYQVSKFMIIFQFVSMSVPLLPNTY